MVRFRKSKKIGAFRFTASKSGLTVSAGVPGARVSVNSKGQVRQTRSIPGTGIYDTKVVGSTDRSARTQAQPRVAGSPYTSTTVESQVHDATNGGRDLDQHDPAVTRLKVVGVSGKFAEIAELAGLRPKDTGWIGARRLGLLVPAGPGEYNVVVMIYPDDNPALFRRGDTTPKGMPFGRLGKPDMRAWAATFAERTIRVVVFINATPGMQHAEVRFFAGALREGDGPYE